MLACLLAGAVAHAAPLQPISCKGPLEPSLPGGCALDPAGCCDGSGRLLYCVGKDLYCIDCAKTFPACGWAPDGPGAQSGGYDCGTSGGADPSAVHPKACSACPASCSGPGSCGAACPGGCGSCAKSGEVCLEDGTCYAPQCGTKTCGSDPKGFPCGTCKPGTACEPGLQQCLPVPPACQGKDTPGCAGCGCESCVCAQHPFCCDVAWDAFCAGACESECGYSCKPCPAKPSCDGLQCGEFCGLQCGTCPKGQVCDKYACCAPACAGKVCGPDGCGGTCGTCTGSDDCDTGQCVACKPKCLGKNCGDNGCGGTCGACTGEDVCVDGQCAVSLCTDKCGGGPLKNAAGKDCYCDAECKGYGDCCPGVCAACPDLKGCCEPACDGKECGEDGCGGTCGQCAGGGACAGGKCTACKAQCDGKQCGPDGCGGTCGACPDGGPCENGQCGACQAKCTGKFCGDDGCGGSCGDCPSGKTCSGGLCVCPSSATTTCCGNAVCPVDTCGGIGAPLYTCSAACVDGECAAPCAPSCVGKVCGGDGCGGTCGSCPAGWECVQGSCDKETADAIGGSGDTAGGAAGIPPTSSSSSGSCSTGAKPASLGHLWALLGAALLLWLRRRTAPALPMTALVLLGVLGCSSPAPKAAEADAASTTSPDNGGEDLTAAGDVLDAQALADTASDVLTDAASADSVPADTVPADTVPADTVPADTVPADSGPDAAPETTPDAALDGAGDVTAADASEPATLTYDCKNLPPGPFALEKVEGAVASEDIAFDNYGYLVGSNNSALFKTKAGAKAKLWVPGVDQRAGMRYLPDGKLAVCDDKLGRILLFDADGSQKVLVQGLSYPNGITTDLKGFIYVTEHDAGRVLRIHPYTGAYTVLTKQIQNPNGVIFNPEFTHLYIGSFGSGWIYKLAVSADGVPGKLIAWASPIGPGGLLDGIGVDACGNVYVCEYGNADIWRIPASGAKAVKIVDADPKLTYLPNMQWGVGKGWDPMSLYIPDGWKIGVWRVQVGVPSAPRPFP